MASPSCTSLEYNKLGSLLYACLNISVFSAPSFNNLCPKPSYSPALNFALIVSRRPLIKLSTLPAFLISISSCETGPEVPSTSSAASISSKRLANSRSLVSNLLAPPLATLRSRIIPVIIELLSFINFANLSLSVTPGSISPTSTLVNKLFNQSGICLFSSAGLYKSSSPINSVKISKASVLVTALLGLEFTLSINGWYLSLLNAATCSS